MDIDPYTDGVLFQGLAAAFRVFSGMLRVVSGRIRAPISRLRREGCKDELQDQICMRASLEGIDKSAAVSFVIQGGYFRPGTIRTRKYPGILGTMAEGSS
jgi:hypothetical protein